MVLFGFTDNGIKFIHRNAWFNNLLGYTEAEIIALQDGNPLIICHPDALEFVKAAAQSIQEGVALSTVSDTRMAVTAGTDVSVISRQPGGIVMYGIETDVEETYRLKQKIEDSKKELERLLSATLVAYSVSP